MKRNQLKISSLCFALAFAACGPKTLTPLADAKKSYQPYALSERPYHGFKESHIVDLDSFIDNFPLSDYEVYDVPSLGKMFLDHVDDYIKNTLKKGEPWESRHIEHIRKYAKPGTTVVDAGTHIGTISIPASRIVGEHGRVLSFEPQPKIFRELNHNLMINGIKNVKTFRYALGDKPGVVQLKTLVAHNEGGTSLANDSAIQGPSAGDIPSTMKAEVVTLDSFKLTNVSLMKVDVEGWEDNFLIGAKETIKANRPVILIEIMGGHEYSGAPLHIKKKINNTVRTLQQMGYQVTRWEGTCDFLALPRTLSVR